MSKLGLCLSGGGSKGAYEIGVYRALRKLKKNPEIVTGTSVGAINGVLIVQGELYKAAKLWRNVSFKMIYDENSFENADEMKNSEIYKQYVKTFMTEGGMDVKGLRTMFDEVYDAKKFFSSPIDFGVVTYNLTKRKPVIKLKKDMKDSEVKDYVLASASCYPAFKPYVIDGDSYIDGGYYDNLPINLAISLGADEIIAVDLRAAGFKRSIERDVPILTISPRNKMASFLVFDSTKAREALHFGYNDTMKTFGKLDGNLFTFKKRNLVRNYNKYAESFSENLHNIFDNLNGSITNKILELPAIKDFLKSRVSYRNFNALVEKAGLCFNFEEDIIYNIKTFNTGLFNELLKIEPINRKIILDKIKNKNFRELFDSQQIVRFFYDIIVGREVESSVSYIALFMDEFLIALYIYVIKGRRKTF